MLLLMIRVKITTVPLYLCCMFRPLKQQHLCLLFREPQQRTVAVLAVLFYIKFGRSPTLMVIVVVIG